MLFIALSFSILGRCTMYFILFHSFIFRDVLGTERVVLSEDYSDGKQQDSDCNDTYDD